MVKLVCIFFLGVCLYSCMNDDVWLERNKPNISVDELIRSKGFIITNEGNFMYGNASLTFYNRKLDTVYNDIFYNQNGIPLGDVAQSITIREGIGYVVVNNSGVIYLINLGKYPHLPAFQYVGKIVGLTSPRYIHFVNSTKAYVTDLYAKSIYIINPTSLKITGKIDVSNNNSKFYQHSTEQMIAYDKYLFVNCWSFDNKILVLNTETDQLLEEIQVDIQPVSMVKDKFDKLWVITDGGYPNSPYGYQNPALYKIDCKTRKIETKFEFKKEDRCAELHINQTKDTITFIRDAIWKMDVTANKLPSSPFIKNEKNLYYGLSIHPITNETIVLDAIDYVQRGVAYIYNSKGIAVDTIYTGITPNEVVFLYDKK